MSVPLKTKTKKQRTGEHYEHLACAFLASQGLRVVCTNYHASRLGEIDIIAEDAQAQAASPTLVFVEVRSRKRNQYADAASSITATKQAKIYKAAEHFLQQHPAYQNWACRFDVLSFDVEADGSVERQWLVAAFGL